jgi:hypothetical protein
MIVAAESKSYREKAAELLRKAHSEADPRARRTYTDMAAHWIELAEDSDFIAKLKDGLEAELTPKQ